MRCVVSNEASVLCQWSAQRRPWAGLDIPPAQHGAGWGIPLCRSSWVRPLSAAGLDEVSRCGVAWASSFGSITYRLICNIRLTAPRFFIYIHLFCCYKVFNLCVLEHEGPTKYTVSTSTINSFSTLSPVHVHWITNYICTLYSSKSLMLGTDAYINVGFPKIIIFPASHFCSWIWRSPTFLQWRYNETVFPRPFEVPRSITETELSNGQQLASWSARNVKN